LKGGRQTEEKMIKGSAQKLTEEGKKKGGWPDALLYQTLSPSRRKGKGKRRSCEEPRKVDERIVFTLNL